MSEQALPGGVVPAPCLNCGAPMTVREATALHTNPTLHCEYCDRVEALPDDANERHRLLRLRLLQIKREREGQEAPLTAFKTIRQSWMFGLVAMLLPAATQFQVLFAPRTVPLPVETLVVVGASAGAFVGVFTGYLGMMKAFAQLVRPLLRARPPERAGWAARCRTCGATLPSVQKPEIVCPHCDATNFLDAELNAHAADLLRAEAEEYRQRATGGRTAKAQAAAYLAPSRAFYRWGFAGAAAGFGVVTSLALLLR